MKNYNLIKILIVFIFFISCDKNPEKPEREHNIWNFSTPVAQEMDPQILDSAFVQAKLTGFIDGLLIIRNGYIVAEEYYNGYNEDRPHNIMSVSDSNSSYKDFWNKITQGSYIKYQGFGEHLDMLSLDLPETNVKLLSKILTKINKNFIVSGDINEE